MPGVSHRRTHLELYRVRVVLNPTNYNPANYTITQNIWSDGKIVAQFPTTRQLVIDEPVILTSYIPVMTDEVDLIDSVVVTYSGSDFLRYDQQISHNERFHCCFISPCSSDHLLQFPRRSRYVGLPTTAEITAIPSAPAAMISSTFPVVIPPIAMTGMVTFFRISRNTSRPCPGPGIIFRRGEKYRAEGEIVCSFPFSQDCFLKGSYRDADDEPGGAICRATPAPRSSCPRWTPSAPQAIAMSGRSFTINRVRWFL